MTEGNGHSNGGSNGKPKAVQSASYPTARADARPQPTRIGGRPSKLTPEVQERICNYIVAGNYFETAAQLCGVSRVQVRAWAKQGATDREKGLKTAAGRFSEALDEAHAKGEARLVMGISKASEKDWGAAKFMLARKYPERWGETLQTQGTLVQVNAESAFASRSEDDLAFYLANGHFPEEA